MYTTLGVIDEITLTYIYIYFFFYILQYGFVNHALELLVLRNYGPEVWEDIK